MLALGSVLSIVGLIVSLVGGIWILVLAFRTSVLWGVGTLIIPLVGIVFAIKNWTVAKRPFLIEIAGVVLLILGSIFTGMGAASLEGAASLFLI